jgi:DNA replication protein DnaC
LPSGQNSPPTAISSSNYKTCPACGNIGIRKTCFKQPINYPLNQIDWCECDYGILALDYWTKKSREKQQKRLDKLFMGAGIPAYFRDFTIETLKARVGNDPAKLAVIAYVETFLADKRIVDPRDNRYKFGLVVSGPFGAGKTGMLTPILRDWLEEGKTGLWIEAKEFVKEIQRGYSRGAEDTSEQKLDEAKRADIILLDDLGDKARQERVQDETGKYVLQLATETTDRIEIIYRLINERHNMDRPMLITTNLTGPELALQLGERTFNRIVESCAWLTMTGKNLRME